MEPNTRQHLIEQLTYEPEAFDSVEWRSAVRYLRRLTPFQEAAVRGYYLEGRSFQSLADKYGRSVACVKSRLQVAIEKLAKAFDHDANRRLAEMPTRHWVQRQLSDGPKLYLVGKNTFRTSCDRYQISLRDTRWYLHEVHGQHLDQVGYSLSFEAVKRKISRLIRQKHEHLVD